MNNSPESTVRAQADILVVEGNILEDRGDLLAALSRYELAAGDAPGYSRPWVNSGNVLVKLGQIERAETAYRKAITLEPGQAGARFNLAKLKLFMSEHSTAEELLREELSLKPDMAEAATVLALILEESGRKSEAETYLRNVLAANPQLPGVAFNLGVLLLSQDRFDEAIEPLSLARTAAPDALSAMLFRLGDHTDLGPAEYFRRHLIVGKAIQDRSGAACTTWTNSPDANRRLRVGYVSADFRRHPIGLLIRPVLEHANRDQFEIHCYSGAEKTDEISSFLRQLPVIWHDVAGITHDDLTALVRRDAIDVLIDLAGHTTGNRLAVFARHPAPVQATWMGYLNTTGLPSMDYRICDAYTDPPGVADTYSTEKLIRLRHSQWCFMPWWAPSEPLTPRRTSGRIRFGSLNRYSKITDSCADIWAEILRRLPNSEISFVGVPDDQRDGFLSRFAARGIDPSRMSVVGRLPLHDYYRAIGDLDIALDTSPYSGGTTTLDTLWMSTPVATLPGDRPSGRSAYSILRSVGMDELIAMSHGELIDINVRLGSDHSWRHDLHNTLRQRLSSSPLMNAPAFVADLESSYRRMWKAWCATQSGVD